MKRIIAIVMGVVLIFALTACGTEDKSASNEGGTEPSETQTEAKEEENVTENEAEETESVTETAALSWPKEFYDWGVPVIEDADVALTEDRSASGNTMTQGVNVIVVLNRLSQDDFKAYEATLVDSGFEKDPTSLEGIMLYYNKVLPEGTIKLTLTYSEDSTTLIANNEAAAEAKVENAGGDVDWPKDFAEVPVFERGKFIETVPMGGNMFILTFLEVEESDLEWYRNELLKAGFVQQEDSDSEGYSKLTNKFSYAVGFLLEGDTFQIILAFGSL